MSDLAVGDCGACIGGDCGGDYCDVSESKFVVARKSHRCCACDKTIERGQRYERIKQLYEGEWDTYQICLICSEISIALSCDGRIIGNMWNDISDNLFPVMTTGCLAKLKTAAVKQHLVNKWNEWKFGRLPRD